MTQQLPDPLMPDDVDLRGLEYMPLLGGRLFSSDFDLEATDAEFRVGLRLWWKAWNQQPAASLPNNEKMLCKLAGFDDNMAKWRKLRDRALHGFVLCSDGRLYHPVLAEQALIAWDKRAEDRAKRDNEAERKRRERAERSRMFNQLRAVGVTPAWNTSTADLRELVTQHVTQHVTRTGHVDQSQPVTRTGTAKTGRDGTGQEYIAPDTRSADSHAGARVADPPPGVHPTQAGLMCRAMKASGTVDVNPGHPDLLALIEAGATEAEFVGAAQTAAGKGKGFAYAIGALKRQRIEAAHAAQDMHRGPMDTAAQPPRRRTAVDRQIATMNALTGKDRSHGPAHAADPATVVDVDARVVR